MKALIAAAIVVTGVPLVAAVGQEAGVTVNAPKQICRRMEVPASGSRISRRRVCMTAAQWRARTAAPTDDAEDELDVLSRSDSGYSNPNNFKAKGDASPQ
jgi:hypothetical protein